MQWIYDLFFEQSIAHSMAIFAIVIAIGVFLGKVKIGGISLGITWILFVGIIFSHFGMSIDGKTLHFVKEFGLILFVYSIGLQVGPSFFSSFKKAGIKLNLLAIGMVSFGVLMTIIIHYITNTPMSTMIGILTGAVTNTPSLGAAQQTYLDINKVVDPSISLGYAVAYPMGVLGIILSMIFFKYIFKIKLYDEEEKVASLNNNNAAHRFSVLVENANLIGSNINKLHEFCSDRHFVVSRICNSQEKIDIATGETIMQKDDKLLIISEQENEEFLTALIGTKVEYQWRKADSKLDAKRIMITNPKVAGKTIGKLGLHGGFAFNITRVNRAGIDLVAYENLELQMGDRLTVVGTTNAILNVVKILGNSMTKLRQPNLVPIFIGIFLGVLVGSIPFTFPFIPQSVKLGLAGGPLIVAILISRFGSRFNLVSYTTVSANLMLREFGIALFLAAVGLSAGEKFVETIVEGGGLSWIAYGMLITVIPAILTGIIARVFLKLDFFSLIGLLSGSTTNPPALAYTNIISGSDLPNISYSTVYPMSMFLRVLSAQLLIIFFC